MARYMFEFRLFEGECPPEFQDSKNFVKRLKSERKFSYAIRIGLIIVWELLNGRVDTLLKEFPWLLDSLKQEAEDQVRAALRAEGDNAIKAQLDAIQRQLASGQLVRQDTPRLLPPSPEDGDITGKLEVTKAKAADKWGNFKTLYNMQLSLYGSEPRRWDNLPTDAIEYGLETGQFPAQVVKAAETLLAARHARKKGQPSPSLPPQETKSAKPLAGAGKELAPPADLDDLDLLG